MKKLTQTIYQSALSLYRILPLKRQICLMINKCKIPNGLFYKDLKFNGPFDVQIENKKFKMIHHGGTIENETFWKGIFNSWENDTGWIWIQLCRFSDVIFDIGANTGIYSLVAKTINEKSVVYAFEPSKNTFDKLRLNNELNEFDITCEKIALSSITGEQLFFDTPDNNQTSASLSAEKLKNWSGYEGETVEYNVKTMTMADYIESHKITRVDLIKLDIEMHEPEAIKGMGKYLNEFKPVVVIEVLSDEIARELNALIDAESYEIFHLENNGIATKQASFSLKPGLWNYIFFHKSLTDVMMKNTTLYTPGTTETKK